jgi:hypothetical protein
VVRRKLLFSQAFRNYSLSAYLVKYPSKGFFLFFVVFRTYLPCYISRGALLGLKPSRLIHRGNCLLAPRRVDLIHPHGFAVLYCAWKNTRKTLLS